MAQAPPILIYQPGGGVSSPIGSNPPVYSQAGTTALVEDQGYVDVVFGSVQTNDEWVLVECIVVNETDVDPLNIWPGIITDKTEAGFRIYLNGLPDSGNYYLHWAVSGINIEPSLASTYLLSGPATGTPGEVATFTVSLPPSTYLNSPVTVTPSEGGLEIGVFSPETVTLTTDSPSATFTFIPGIYGETTITVNNDRGLTDPVDLAFTALASTYTLNGPSSGDISVASTDFTVELPVGGVVAGTVTVTPDDGSDGTFTPTTVVLTTIAPSDTFTYTPASVGDKMISVTNDGDLTDPVDILYTVTAPFSPLDIAGCKLWLKADALPVVADGTAVATWPDSSGNGNDFTGAAAYYTNIINAKPVVRFDGVNNQHGSTTASILPVGTTGYTIFVVFAPASVSAGDHYVFNSGGASESVIIRRQTTDLYFYQYSGSGFVNVADTGGMSAGVWKYYTFDWNASNIHMWKNGTLVGVSGIALLGAAGTKTYLARNVIGGAAAPGDSDIAEVLVYNSSLSSTDRGNVEAFLAAKYGL